MEERGWYLRKRFCLSHEIIKVQSCFQKTDAMELKLHSLLEECDFIGGVQCLVGTCFVVQKQTRFSTLIGCCRGSRHRRRLRWLCEWRAGDARARRAAKGTAAHVRHRIDAAQRHPFRYVALSSSSSSLSQTEITNTQYHGTQKRLCESILRARWRRTRCASTAQSTVRSRVTRRRRSRRCDHCSPLFYRCALID
jgi:hypothetical protein